MFGVGVVTAPPERKMQATGIRPETVGVARRQQMQVGADKALTPIYPANPGGQADIAETDKHAVVETTGSGGTTTTGLAANQSEPAARVEPGPSEPETAPTEMQTVATDASQPATANADATRARSEGTGQGAQAATIRKPDHCDVAACSAAYKSFRASDCTYQPYDGARQLCEPSQASEAPPAREAARATAPAAEPRDNGAELRAAVEAVKKITGLPAGRRLVPFAERGAARAGTSCNVAACAQAYDSFNPADCTFQPYDGPRQLCAR
jgi:hypothetical protein